MEFWGNYSFLQTRNWGEAGEVCLSLSLELDLEKLWASCMLTRVLTFFSLQHYFLWPDYCYTEHYRTQQFLSNIQSLWDIWLFNISLLPCVCGGGCESRGWMWGEMGMLTLHTHVHAWVYITNLCVEARDWCLFSCLHHCPLLFLIQGLSLNPGLTSS